MCDPTTKVEEAVREISPDRRDRASEKVSAVGAVEVRKVERGGIAGITRGKKDAVEVRNPDGPYKEVQSCHAKRKG